MSCVENVDAVVNAVGIDVYALPYWPSPDAEQHFTVLVVNKATKGSLNRQCGLKTGIEKALH